MTRAKPGKSQGKGASDGPGAFAETRQRLLKRRQELQAHVQALESDQRRTSGPLSADFAEQASERENDEVVDALLIRARNELANVNGALSRIDAGSYGRCAVCGEPIEAPRLAAVPYTSRCGACADAA